MSKILKNTTQSDIPLNTLGLPDIPAGGQIEIQEFDYISLSSEDSVTYLDPLIASGDVVINDGLNDLTVLTGKAYIRYPDTAFNIRFLSGVSRSNGFASKNVQEAIEESRTGFEGKGFQVSYIGNGMVKNAWLKQEDQNIESNQTPDIFKFKARLVGINFSNQNKGVDCTIKIAIRRHPFNNLNDIDDSYKWTLTNVRSAEKTNQTSGFTINPGDVMAVYVEDNGGDPNDLVISMDFIVLEAANQEIQVNYSGNFSSSDFPSTGSIPEVLV